ncbi:hypothetical protein FRC01_001505 [Tulasnella sp. 417]|nr:hypothetical protein FRC01_001505 [Tulasnella sp. 417]
MSMKLHHPNIADLDGFVEDVSKRDITHSMTECWIMQLNILIYDDSQFHIDHKIYARITDFGSARRIVLGDPEIQTKQTEHQPRSAEELQATFCASTNTIALTGNQYSLRWAAPELIMEDQLDLWSDVWALGWIAYEPMVVPNINRLRENDKSGGIHLLIQVGRTYESQGEHERALDFFVKAVDRSRKLGLLKAMMSSMLNLARLGPLPNEYMEAIPLCSEIQSQYCKNEDLADALCDLIQLHRLRNESNWAGNGRTSKGADIQEQERIANILCQIADMYREEMAFDQAFTLYSEAVDLWADPRDRRRGSVLWGLAELHRRRSEYDKAIPLYSEALENWTDPLDGTKRNLALDRITDIRQRQCDQGRPVGLSSMALDILPQPGGVTGEDDSLLASNNALWRFRLNSDMM